MNIAKALIGRASCVLAMVALGSGPGAWAQAGPAAPVSVKFATLHSFNYTDGGSPESTLVQATNGDLYGTTWGGGANGFGTVFKITPGGKLTTLYNFCSQSDCSDGAGPTAGLVQATNGDLYGTTSAGGVTNPSCPYGSCGTIFQITPSGTLTTIHTFCSQSGCPDGQTPLGGLVQAANGDLYGTTTEGGVSTIAMYGGGTVFKITLGGTLTTVYNFCSESACSDGDYPTAGPVQGTDGNLYGITELGGPHGGGTIYKITPSGTVTTMYSFCSQSACADGQSPFPGLIQAANGDLYGTTYYGGANVNTNVPYGGGTVFKITPSAEFTTVYNFCAQSGCADGDLPQAGLRRASDGNLYGMTAYGGSNTNPTVPYGGGTIFSISPTDALTTLYSFCAQSGCADGFSPIAGLVQDTFGGFYGTTLGGGAGGNNRGTVFALSTGAPPFVETRPTIGAVGEVVTIVGYGLNGATSVSFSGIPATILYDAPAVIYAKVPAGATTGKVQVVTPSGTLTSNVAFEVAP